MRSSFTALAVVLLTLIPLLSCSPAKSGPVLVDVGDEAITQGDIDLLVAVNPRLKARLQTDAGKRQVLDNYVEQSLLYQEALKRNLHKDDLIKAKIDLYRKVILAQGLLDTRLDEETRAYYDANRDEFEKIKVAHIYVPFKTEEKNRVLGKEAGKVKRTEDEAKQRIATAQEALKKDPESFGKLVAEYSEDPKTKEREGEIGWVTGQAPRLKRWGWTVLADKAFAMNAGEISEPIRSDNGYHLLKVLEGKQVDAFEDAETRIRFKIQADIKSRVIEELKESYKVAYADAEEEAEAEEVPAAEVVEEAAEATPQGEE